MPPLSQIEVSAFLNQREIARAQKDWATADAIRETLRGRGVELYDTSGLWKDNRGG
eukprot:COSAG02_NODE_66520_length_255_cov_0.660256_1_plen_55_part_10